MGKKTKRHQIVIRNLTPTDELVRERVESELGPIRIMHWWEEDQIHGSGLVAGGGMMPQRISIIVVEYEEE